MNEQRTTDAETGLDKIFAALRSIGVRRRTDDKWIAGVCSGLADRLGVDPVIVRVGLVVLSLLWGAGITIYLVAWALLPNDRNQIVIERALRDGDGGSIVVMVFAGLALFGGSWWGSSSGWGFPWGLVLAGALIWWLVQRSSNRPDADQRVSAQAPTAAPYATTPYATTPFNPGQQPTTSGPMTATTGGAPSTYRPAPTTYRPEAPRRLRRRSGGGLMALLAIGLSLVTYGSLSWLGSEFHWTGNHWTIAMAGSLAAIGLLLVVLGPRPRWLAGGLRRLPGSSPGDHCLVEQRCACRDSPRRAGRGRDLDTRFGHSGRQLPPGCRGRGPQPERAPQGRSQRGKAPGIRGDR